MKLIDILKEIHGTSVGMMLNNKPVDIKSIEIDDVDQTDYPDFSDAYISHATYINGMPLSDTELEQLNDQESEFINQKIHDDQLYIQEGEEEEYRPGGKMAGQWYQDREDAAERSRYNRPSYGHSNKSNMVGITFFEVPSGKEEEAKRLGLTQFKSGKFGVKHQFDKNIISVASDREKSMVSSAERTFGKGRYWEPKK